MQLHWERPRPARLPCGDKWWTLGCERSPLQIYRVGHYIGAGAKNRGGTDGALRFPRPKHGAVRVECGEQNAENACWKSAGAAAILYTRLATRFLYEERRPQAQVCIGHMSRHGAYDRVVFYIEGLNTVACTKGAPVRMCR